jgi:hypothetical protein
VEVLMRRGVAPLALVLVLGALAVACFSPREPACAFSCATDGLCPASYTCGSDGLCHRADGVGVCLLTAVDGGARADGGAD